MKENWTKQKEKLLHVEHAVLAKYISQEYITTIKYNNRNAIKYHVYILLVSCTVTLVQQIQAKFDDKKNNCEAQTLIYYIIS